MWDGEDHVAEPDPVADPVAALGIGALVSIRAETGPGRPALVVATDDDTVTLNVARRQTLVVGEDVTVSFAIAGVVRELRTRVTSVAQGSAEVGVDRDAVPAERDERREVDRFALAAEALLVLGEREYAGRSTDLSVLGAGLVVAGAGGPVPGDEGELLLHDAGGELLPGAVVRVAFVEQLAPAGRQRVGVEFIGGTRAPDATARLLGVLAR